MFFEFLKPINENQSTSRISQERNKLWVRLLLLSAAVVGGSVYFLAGIMECYLQAYYCTWLHLECDWACDQQLSSHCLKV
jgi:hypothetical protein